MAAVPYQDLYGNGYGAIKMLAGDACTKGYFVEHDSTNGGVKNLAADGDRIMGIAKETAAADAYVMIYTSGIFTIAAESGDDFKQGEVVYPTNDGKVIDGVTGDYQCGYAFNAFAAGGTSQFVLVPSIIDNVAKT